MHNENRSKSTGGERDHTKHTLEKFNLGTTGSIILMADNEAIQDCLFTQLCCESFRALKTRPTIKKVMKLIGKARSAPFPER